jgi:enterochelin esterase family protein
MRDLVFLFAAALVQDPAVPASSNVRGSEFPAVHSDRRVTFRFQAPEAGRVEVKCRGSLWGGKPVPMSKGADGVWTVTTEPGEPGFYYYEFVVDGVSVNDPGSRTYPGWAREMSGLEIPDRKVDFYDVKPVPHGEVRVRTYFSKTTETTRQALVYTPPDYDRDPARRYPVLYLQHGSGESERSWTAQGRANYILDNLIAEGKTEEMILVMEQGYATKAGTAPAAEARGNEGFEELVVNDLVPMVDAVYRTIPKRGSRAVAGLSMGGAQAIRIGLGHPELFGSVASLSGGMRGPRLEGLAQALSNPAAFNEKVDLFWIGCGRHDVVFPRAREAHEALEKARVTHVWFETDGGHEWQVWRKSLHDLVPRLFRKK